MLLVKLAAACALCALLSVAAGQVNPALTEEERKAEILARMSGNSFVSDPVVGTAVVEKMVALQNQIKAQGGCAPNLCFGIDGSKLLTESEYLEQIDFMALIAGTVGASLGFEDKVNLIAFRYAGALRRMSPATKNVDTFFDNIERDFGPRTSSRAFLASAILACRRDMQNNFVEDANKIVLIGDGRTTYRGNRLSIREANKFRPPNFNGAVCAVTVANPDTKFLEQVAGGARRVLKVEETKRFIDLLDEVVKDVCDLFGSGF